MSALLKRGRFDEGWEKLTVQRVGQTRSVQRIGEGE